MMNSCTHRVVKCVVMVFSQCITMWLKRYAHEPAHENMVVILVCLLLPAKRNNSMMMIKRLDAPVTKDYNFDGSSVSLKIMYY